MSADGQIKSFFERWENLEAEKKQVSDLLKDLFAEAKSFGYDTKALRAAFRLKVKEDLDNPADAEFEAVVDTYLNAINAPSIFTRDARLRTRENIEEIRPSDTGKRFKATVYDDGSSEVETIDYDRETGEILDAKLVETIAKGVQTDIGRAALLAAVDIMMEREDAEEEFQAKASGDNGATGQAAKVPTDSVTGDASRSSRGDDSPAPNFGTIEHMHQQIAAARSDGGLNIVHKHTEIATASQGEAGANNSAERETDRDAAAERDRAAANIGGDHVTAHPSTAAQAGDPVSKPPAAYSLRPHCRNPGNACGGYGSTHCHSCKIAMREMEEA